MVNKFIPFAIVALFSFTAAFSQKKAEVSFKTANRYFVKNNVKSDKIQTLKIADQANFHGIFGMATVMGKNGRPTPIDFNKEFVLAVIGNETNMDTKLTPISLKKDHSKLIFEYEIKTVGGQRSFTIVPCLLILVDNKYKDKEVVFKED